MRTASTLLLATATLFATACGGATDDGTDGSEASAPVAGGAADVEIRDNVFDPEVAEVVAGDTVTWTHGGDIVHNVTFDDGEASETLEAGDTYARTFDEAGTFAYACTFHPGMEGTVTVG